MSFSEYKHSYMTTYMLLLGNPVLSTAQTQGIGELIKDIYVNYIFNTMSKYLNFKIWLWYSGQLGCLSGTPRKVLFSKATIIPSFRNIRVTGHIPTSTTVFPVFCDLYMIPMLNIFALFWGRLVGGQNFGRLNFRNRCANSNSGR